MEEKKKPHPIAYNTKSCQCVIFNPNEQEFENCTGVCSCNSHYFKDDCTGEMRPAQHEET